MQDSRGERMQERREREQAEVRAALGEDAFAAAVALALEQTDAADSDSTRHRAT